MELITEEMKALAYGLVEFGVEKEAVPFLILELKKPEHGRNDKLSVRQSASNEGGHSLQDMRDTKTGLNLIYDNNSSTE